MAVRLFIENPRTKKKFVVTNYDKDTNMLTIKGDYGEFQEPKNLERFKSLGYVLGKEEVPDATPAEETTS